MSADVTMAVFVLSLFGLGFFLGWLTHNNLKKEEVIPGPTKSQRDTLAYVQKLLNNYHAAHLQSPLSGVEIEEVLRLVKEKVGEVLEG